MSDEEEGTNANKQIDIENENELCHITGISNSHTIMHKPKLVILNEKAKTYDSLAK